MSGSSVARQRIEALLDESSFVEIGALVHARNTDFNLRQENTLTDGVITGYGVVDGRPVYVFSQEPDVLGGSVGEMHAKKIVRLYDLALKTGAPVVGIIDSTGMRLQEGADALNALGEIYLRQANASGVIPQISVVMGGCGGGLAVMSALSDFTFLESEKGKLFLHSPNAIDNNYKEKCDTSAAAFQSEKAGTVDVLAPAASIFEEVRTLLSFLPSSNAEDDAEEECVDDLNRLTEGIDAAMPDPAAGCAYLADSGEFFEVKDTFAPELVTGFLRLNGATVGVIANRTARFDAEGKETETYPAQLTERGCEKAARFVRFLDAFDLPLLTLTDVEGFAATMCEERRLAGHAAALVAALADATIPKVNLITRRAIGSAGLIMNGGATGADFTICWPDAQIGTMEASLAAKILADGKGADEEKACAEAYARMNSAEGAASHGYTDEIIAPADTRKYIIGAFEMLYSKQEERPAKKHGAV